MVNLLAEGGEAELTMEDFIKEVVDTLERDWDRRGLSEQDRWKRIRLMEQGMGLTKEDN